MWYDYVFNWFFEKVGWYVGSWIYIILSWGKVYSLFCDINEFINYFLFMFYYNIIVFESIFRLNFLGSVVDEISFLG